METEMPSKPQTSNAEELSYEVVRVPNAHNERGRLAREAAGLSQKELAERAAAVGVDTAGASKAELMERVRDLRGA
jgi:ribosome-binding protein aMBF1 (putative translation factor)